MTHSTLLGAIREKAHIEWEYDEDIRILLENENQRNVFKNILKQMNLRYKMTYRYGRIFLDWSYFSDWGEISYDIKIDDANNYDYENLETIEYCNGISVFAPPNPKQVLENMYGNDGYIKQRKTVNYAGKLEGLRYVTCSLIYDDFLWVTSNHGYTAIYLSMTYFIFVLFKVHHMSTNT